MIDIRPSCENCDAKLPPNSEEAMMCAFECTFCKNCVETILYNVCPNCGGGFEKRPILPRKYVLKYPPSDKKTLKPIDEKAFQEKLRLNRDVKPSAR